MKFKFLLLQVCLLLFCFNVTYGTISNYFGGIEVGGNGIKMTVIEITNFETGTYSLKQYWTVNVGLSSGIAVNGRLASLDMENAVKELADNYLKMKNEFNIPNNHIFLVSSSGIARAKNFKVFSSRVKQVTGKDLGFISPEQEGKMLLAGLIPVNRYSDSMVLDIGGSNTKGGFVDIYNKFNFVFFPVSLNYGSVTLAKALNKTDKVLSLSEFLERRNSFVSKLDKKFKDMFISNNGSAVTKENIYMSGGAVWAFYTLVKGKTDSNYNQFRLEDVIFYDAILRHNFKKFEEMAKMDSEVKRVLKTYNHQQLLSGSAILISCLSAIKDVSNKNIYFARDGQMAWLINYILSQDDRNKTKIW